MRAAVEPIDNFENRLLSLLGRGVRQEKTSYSQMSRGARFLRDQGIRCFLDTVMEENPTGVLGERGRASVAWTASFTRRRAFPPPKPLQLSLPAVPKSALLPRQANCFTAFSGFCGQAVQLSHHEVDYIVRIILSRIDTGEIPRPL